MGMQPFSRTGLDSPRAHQWISLILFGLVSFFQAVAQRPSFGTNGLVAYYPLTAGLTGEFGSPPLESMNPPAFLSDRRGAFFDGTNSFSYASTKPALSAFDSRDSYTVSFAIQAPWGGNVWVPVLSATADDVRHLGTLIHVGNNVISLAQGNRAADGWWLEQSFAVDLQEPRFVSMVFQRSNDVDRDGVLTLYVDGVAAGSVPMHVRDSGSAGKPDMESIFIGYYPHDGPPFVGRFRSLSIFNRALSPGEARTLYEYEASKGLPRQASATPVVVNGFVVGATLADEGYGYLSAPAVRFLGGSGTGAAGYAVVEGGILVSIIMTNPGIGYATAPTIVVEPPPYPPTQARGVGSVVNGFVTGIVVVDGGRGYGNTPPPVHLLRGGGLGAKAVANVSNGVVTGITIVSPGSGYTSAPTVLIAAPPGSPKLGLEVSQVKVVLDLLRGYSYKVQTSADGGQTWMDMGFAFLAEEPRYTQIFDVIGASQLFRVLQVP
jgi:hypothetical protein